MNNRALTISLIMAIVAVVFVQSYVSGIEEEAKKKFGTEVLVLKAKREIKEQSTIDETMVELALIPKKFLEPSAIYFDKREEDKETSKAIKELAGQVASVPIRKGEQLANNKITQPGIRTGLAPQIAPGKRAMAVPVNEITGVAKLVKPGDRVDLIAVLDQGGGKENRIAKTILQDVVVLSVGRNVTNNPARTVESDGKTEKVRSLSEDSSFVTVTLELEPVQVQTLALVIGSGENSLSLSLRNNDDSDRVVLGPTTVNDVLGAEAARLQRLPAGGQRR